MYHDNMDQRGTNEGPLVDIKVKIKASNESKR